MKTMNFYEALSRSADYLLAYAGDGERIEEFDFSKYTDFTPEMACLAVAVAMDNALITAGIKLRWVLAEYEAETWSKEEPSEDKVTFRRDDIAYLRNACKRWVDKLNRCKDEPYLLDCVSSDLKVLSETLENKLENG